MVREIWREMDGARRDRGERGEDREMGEREKERGGM